MVRISDTAIFESYIQNSHAVWVHIIKHIHFTCLIIFVWNRLVMSPVFTFQYASVQHHARSESELVPPEVDMNSACDWLWIYGTGVIASAFHNIAGQNGTSPAAQQHTAAGKHARDLQRWGQQGSFSSCQVGMVFLMNSKLQKSRNAFNARGNIKSLKTRSKSHADCVLLTWGT